MRTGTAHSSAGGDGVPGVARRAPRRRSLRPSQARGRGHGGRSSQRLRRRWVPWSPAVARTPRPR